MKKPSFLGLALASLLLAFAAAESETASTTGDSLIEIEELILEPSTVGRMESSVLKFRFSNKGEYTVYNVRYQIRVRGNPEMFEFKGSYESVAETFRPGDFFEGNETVLARSNAEGEHLIELVVDYHFGNGTHQTSGYETLAVTGPPMEWLATAVMVLLILLVLTLILTKRFDKEGARV